MANNANVLGIACTTNEVITPSAFTNDILQPYLTWLGQNPTKRPQYLIAFLDIPSRVHEGTNTYDSVFYQLHTKTPSHRPFVMTINMNGTNDCRAYIDKLRFFGTNYSPGKLLISASATGTYNNTNYVVDNVRHFFYGGDGNKVSVATNGLAAAGVPSSAIQYLEGVENCTQWVSNECVAVESKAHLTNVANVAGYISWGAHSSLGGFYAADGRITWAGASSWWIIETIESFNGVIQWPQMGHFSQWYSAGAFGGAAYSNTPVGAVTHVDEPYIFGVNSADTYFRLWATGRGFAICAWNSRNTERFQAVGDPFVRK